jgi:hypothetical protein
MGAPRSDLRQNLRALLPVPVRPHHYPGALPIFSLSDCRREAFCANPANPALMTKLKTANRLDAFVQHRPFKLGAEVSIAFTADTAQRKIRLEYAETLRNYVFAWRIIWQFRSAIDALVHWYVV